MAEIPRLMKSRAKGPAPKKPIKTSTSPKTIREQQGMAKASGGQEEVFMRTQKKSAPKPDLMGDINQQSQRMEEGIERLKDYGVYVDTSTLGEVGGLKTAQDQVTNMMKDPDETDEEFKARQFKAQEILSNVSRNVTSVGKGMEAFNEEQERKAETAEQDQTKIINELQKKLNEAQTAITEKDKELTSVSAQVADFGVKLDEIKASHAEAITSLNSSIQGLGDYVASMSAQMGADINFSDPNVQQQIKQIWRQPGNMEQKTQKMNNFLRNLAGAGGGAAPQGLYHPDPVKIQETTPVSPGAAPVTSTPELDEAHQISATEASYYSSPVMNFDNLSSYLSSQGSDGSTFFSDDMDLMMLRNISGYDDVRLRLQDLYESRRQSTQYWFDTYNDHFAEQLKAGEDMLALTRDTAMMRIDRELEWMKAERADEVADLDDKTTRIEGFIKARMVAAGIPMEGQAGATMLANSMSRWYRTANKIKNDYDFKINTLHDRGIEILNNYASNMIKLKMQNDSNLLNTQFKLNENWQKTQESILFNDTQIQLKQIQSVNDYIKSEKQAQRDLAKEMRAQANKERERIWNLQKDNLIENGLLATVDENGMPTAMLDADGKPILSIKGEKLYKEMAMIGKEVRVVDDEVVIVDMLNPGNKTYLGGNYDPNIDFPLTGVEATGTFTISIGDKTYGNGEKYTGQSQCVGGTREACEDLPGGLDNIYDKRQVYSGFTSFYDMQPGDGVFFNGGPTVTSRFSGTKDKSGHAATIESIDWANRTVRVIEVNKNGDNRWGVGVYKFEQIDRNPENDVLGIFRPENPQVPVIEGQIHTSMDNIHGESDELNVPGLSQNERFILAQIRSGTITKTEVSKIRKKADRHPGLYSRLFLNKLEEYMISPKAKPITAKQAQTYNVSEGITQFMLDDILNKRNEMGYGNRRFQTGIGEINSKGEAVGLNGMNNFFLLGEKLNEAQRKWEEFKKAGGTLRGMGQIIPDIGFAAFMTQKKSQGKWNRFWDRASELFGGEAETALNLFRELEALTGDTLVRFVKKISGVAVSDKEFQKLKQLKPNVSMTDDQFEDQLIRAVQEYNASVQAKLNMFNFQSFDQMKEAVRGTASRAYDFPINVMNEKVQDPLPDKEITIPNNMSREQAIKFLQSQKAPTTEDNIQYVIDQSNK